MRIYECIQKWLLQMVKKPFPKDNRCQAQTTPFFYRFLPIYCTQGTSCCSQILLFLFCNSFLCCFFSFRRQFFLELQYLFADLNGFHPLLHPIDAPFYFRIHKKLLSPQSSLLPPFLLPKESAFIYKVILPQFYRESLLC